VDKGGVKHQRKIEKARVASRWRRGIGIEKRKSAKAAAWRKTRIEDEQRGIGRRENETKTWLSAIGGKKNAPPRMKASERRAAATKANKKTCGNNDGGIMANVSCGRGRRRRWRRQRRASRNVKRGVRARQKKKNISADAPGMAASAANIDS